MITVYPTVPEGCWWQVCSVCVAILRESDESFMPWYEVTMSNWTILKCIESEVKAQYPPQERETAEQRTKRERKLVKEIHEAVKKVAFLAKYDQRLCGEHAKFRWCEHQS